MGILCFVTLLTSIIVITVNAQTPASLTVTKTVNPTDVSVGEWFTVTIEVSGYGNQWNNAPSNVDIIEVTQNYIVDVGSFSIAPDALDYDPDPSTGTEMDWYDVGDMPGVGDGIDPLMASETFTVTFMARCNVAGVNLPVDADASQSWPPLVRFHDPFGQHKWDHIPQAYINVTEYGHDVEAVSQTVTLNEVMPGDIVDINVTVQNNGNFNEDFNVTCYYDSVNDSVEIDTIRVLNLAPGNSTVVTFSWNTTGVPLNGYPITAWADSSDEIDELDEDNNECIMPLTLFVIPELPLGTILATLSMFLALIGYIGFKRYRTK